MEVSLRFLHKPWVWKVPLQSEQGLCDLAVGSARVGVHLSLVFCLAIDMRCDWPGPKLESVICQFRFMFLFLLLTACVDDNISTLIKNKLDHTVSAGLLTLPKILTVFSLCKGCVKWNNRHHAVKQLFCLLLYNTAFGKRLCVKCLVRLKVCRSQTQIELTTWGSPNNLMIKCKTPGRCGKNTWR